MYEVTIDFGDHALQSTKLCENLTELGLYLERVPSLIGFEINGQASVSIRTKSSSIKQEHLPIQVIEDHERGVRWLIDGII
jgi:hypothetical protein